MRGAVLLSVKRCFGGNLQGRTFGAATITPSGLSVLQIEAELSAADRRLAQAFN